MVVTAWMAPELVVVLCQSHRRDAPLAALRGRIGLPVVHALWALAGHPLGAGEALNVPALNGSPLPADIREPCFQCSASVGPTEAPFQGRREQSQIRTHPYTPNARGREIDGARAREVHEEMSRIGCEIRFLMEGSGVLGAQVLALSRATRRRWSSLAFRRGMRLS